MANKQTVGELVYKISAEMDELKSDVNRAEKEILKLKKGVDETEKSTKKTTNAFSKMGLAIKAAVVGFISRVAIKFMQDSVRLASERIEQETKLAQVLRISTNATDEQIASLNRQAVELEKVGVLGRDVITAAQGQLATFDLQTESIESLTPALMNYIVAEKGVNATRQDAIALSNGMAQALQGNFGSLTRTGFVLDEETKKLIANGTEKERVIALAGVLDSTYKDLNETMAGTFLGTQVRVKRALDNFKEDLGFALMPAIQVFTNEILGLSDGMTSGEERINKWGLSLYKASHFIMGTGRLIGLLVKSLVGLVDILWTVNKTGLNTFKALAEAARGNFKKAFATAKEAVNSGAGDIMKKGKELSQSLSSDWEKIGDNAEGAFSGRGFEAVSAAAISAWEEGKKSNQAFGDQVEDTADQLEKFQTKMVGVVENARKVKESLENDLTKSFEKFSESLANNFNETNQSLAGIVIGAEDKIKELKEALSNTDDFDQAQSLRDQIQEQEKILEAREGFEERQSERIALIREKLEEAGIDSTKAGFDNLLNVRGLEEEIEEQRRLASLDEFTRFEEGQTKKLILLADSFITEMTILQEKIEKQEAFETELTEYLKSEESKRLGNTEAWAQSTIAKYQDVGRSLEGLLSTQAKLSNVLNPSIMPSLPSSALASDQMNQSGNTTNNNVNANVAINGQTVNNLKPEEISAILGFELNKYIGR